ncbi:SusC/RagA family TonB-linked outer membrane protein [Chitinophaga filiformis]|uniref:SusC/RagA family TonB-linked outer membrane protein n=1 Tax=Chitinophaga filiformis TaxID=104663 RepID=A0ABY4HYA6_CHIFI|nr:SusC/RagA family TonB-linked outer membrane protein [Chitinophaga filiformis]UPK67994.1 SusC/RagA family TonB-linked outer membrane protein [Chitinophaga filiformis]
MRKTVFITLILTSWLFFYADAQKINLTFNNAPLAEVMNALDPWGYDYYPDTTLTIATRLISGHFVNEDIEKILAKVMEGQPFNWKLYGTDIILKYKGLRSGGLSGQRTGTQATVNISGTVRGGSDERLIGATVQLKEIPGRATKTDGNGNFVLEGVPPKGTMIVSHLGFETVEMGYEKRTLFNITLIPKLEVLKEQKVTLPRGYYSVFKLFNTGAVSLINGNEISAQPVGDILMAMESRATGVYVAQNSGIPGASVNVNIRGINSMANGNSPLYVIDGVPFNLPALSQTPNAPGTFSIFTVLRPEDVESITILKDADATAIYGSRGANGVILITTKKTVNTRTKIDVNVYTGFNQVAGKLKLMNTADYLQLRREAVKNDQTTPRSDDYDINGSWDTSGYTDWEKYLAGKIAKLTTAQIGISAGNEQTQFRIVGKYRHEESVYHPGDFFNRVRSFGGSIYHQSLNKKFLMKLGADYSYLKYVLPQTDFYKNAFMSPNAPAALNPDGKLNWPKDMDMFLNPAAESLKTSETTIRNLMGYFQASYRLVEGLQLINNFGYISTELSERAITPSSSFNPITQNTVQNRLNQSAFNEVMTWHYEPQVNYSKIFNGLHNLEVTAGATFQQSINNRTRLDALGFDNDDMITNVAAGKLLTGRQDNSKYVYNALFARVGYRYNDKYLLNLTGRRDGSSRLSPGKRFGNFGAIGAAWIFTEEEFMKKLLPLLTFGKIRASYGITGNDQIQDYQYVNRYMVGAGMGGNGGLVPVQLTNNAFGWEVIKKSQIGLELGLRSQIFIDAMYYLHRTTNQLVAYAIPATTGYSSITTNIPAKVENNGFELELHSQNIRMHNFSWQTNFNISFPKNRLLSYPNFPASDYALKYALDMPLSIRYLYDYNRVDPTTGLYTFHQHQEDNVLNRYDKVPTFIGQHFFGGLGNTLSYKGWNLDLFFQFVKQTGYLPGGLTSPGRNLYGGANQPARYTNRWRKPGDIARYQRASASDAAALLAAEQYEQSDATITDASFIRLKNVCLSYTLPNRILRKLKVQNARFYMQGQNLFIITGYEGADPETSHYGLPPSLPPMRTMVTGLQITF